VSVRAITVVILFSFLASCLVCPRAMAIASFQSAFYKKYVDRKKNPDFHARVKLAKCWLCHNYDPEEPSKKLKNNSYSLELAKLLNHEHDKKDKEKIVKALETVATIQNNPDDENSPTYGELIVEGKFPGGEPVMPPKKSEGEE
jgi:hypothetical protein